MNEDIGPLNLEAMGNIGKHMTSDILEGCKDIVNEIEKQTINLLTKNKQYMIKIAESLLKNETISYKEIGELIPKRFENSKEIKL